MSPANPPPPFQLQRIDHVVLRVRNLPAAEAFYTQVLGCAVARRREDLGLLHLRAGDSLIDLVDADGPLARRGAGDAPAPSALDHVALRIHPFEADALRAHLARHGVRAGALELQQFGADGEGPALYLQDPDGHRIELKGAHA